MIDIEKLLLKYFVHILIFSTSSFITLNTAAGLKETLAGRGC